MMRRMSVKLLGPQFLLITSSSGCGSTGADNVHTYFLVSSVSFDGLKAILQAAEVALEAAMTDLDLAWGQFKTLESSSTGGSGSTGTGSLSASGNGGPGPNGGPGSSATSAPSASGSAANGGSESLGPSSSGGLGASDTSAPGSSSTSPPGSLGSSSPSSNLTPMPPSSADSGFPTAPLGDAFDETLDSSIGYLNSSDFSSFLSQIAPGITDTNVNDYRNDDTADSAEDPTTASKKRIRKRWSFKSLVQKVSSKIVSVVQQTASVVKSGLSVAVSTVKRDLGPVLAAIASFFNPSLDETFNLNLAPSKLVDSPFGQAYQIFRKDGINNAQIASGSVAL
ncbi:MAG: hypothetical protein Q9227_007594 [Pyrenula ochraceoflavens]